jgi:hypothetical protein
VVAEGDWLAQAADVLVVPDVLAIGVRRDHPDGAAARDLARLESGDGGFHEAARWPMEYLHQRLYAWLDPGLSPCSGVRLHGVRARPCALSARRRLTACAGLVKLSPRCGRRRVWSESG